MTLLNISRSSILILLSISFSWKNIVNENCELYFTLSKIANFILHYLYQHGITCINCHDPHKLSNTADKPEGNQACMKCHSLGSLIGPHQDTLEQHTHHKADSKGSLCIECHMPRTAKHTEKSPLTVRSHLFSFIYPAQTKAYAMPPETNACYACHKDKTLDSLQGNLRAWGRLDWEKLELPSLNKK